MTPILEVRGLTHIYSVGTPFEHTALDHVSFSVEKGEFLGIIGHTGSGKSTLLRSLNLLETPSSGQILYHGTDVAGRGVNAPEYRSHVGMVFQSFNLVTRTTVIKNVLSACVPDMPFWRVLLGAFRKADKIKALECGASVFIDKPFDMDYLLGQVANLIKTQNELKQRYSRKYIAEPSKITISSVDEELLKKAMNYIERNMDNSDYNVDSFVSDMSIGRTLLYQKINDITGMSIKEFIMDVRLKRSAQLLRESDLTISEISVLTGFANPKYFSICFKRHFELTPSEFKKKS